MCVFFVFVSRGVGRSSVPIHNKQMIIMLVPFTKRKGGGSHSRGLEGLHIFI